MGKNFCMSIRHLMQTVRSAGRVNTQIFFVPPIRERLNTHSDFLRVLAADLSTRHSWRDINLDDVYTRIYFSESSRPRLTMNEFTLFVDICLIPLSNTCSFGRSSHGFVKTDLYPLYRGPLIYVRDTVFSTLHWSTCRPLLRACQRSNFAEERRP